jgi:DNA-directed RNA polymerase specialized sigma subunit
VIIPEITPVEPSSFIEQMMMLAEADINNDEPNWDIIDAVANAISHLGDDDKMLIQLYYYEHKTYNKITEIMGYSSKSVAWYAMQKALDNLERKLLEDTTIKKMLKEAIWCG